ncbi:MAG: hypothetical protein ACFFB5_08275 [Promethearchaeota archaeon]
MKKGVIWSICFGLLFLMPFLLILFSDFWLGVFIPPAFSLENIIYILLLIFLSFLAIGLIIWRKTSRESRKVESIKQFEPRAIEMGLCLGSITDDGLSIRGKTKSCPFNESVIQSMLEYCAVLYQHGEIETIYGPFPLTSIRMGEKKQGLPEEEMHFISFGFQVIDPTVKDTRMKIPSGGVLAVLLLYYPKKYESLIIMRKKHLINLFKSMMGTISDISVFNPEKLDHIENDIRVLSFF